MSLRRKMTVQIAAMIVGLLLISAAALWGINALNQDYDFALAGYRQLRTVYGDVGYHLATARELLAAAPADRARAAEQLDKALARFDLFLSEPRQSPNDPRDQKADAELRQAIAAAAGQLHAPGNPNDHELQLADMAAIQQALLQMRTFASELHGVIQVRRDAAALKRRDTILAVGVLCAAIIIGAVLLGLLQYRSVMLPLHRLGAGVRKIAAGQFKQRLDERGTQEFAALANDFNRMAGELDEFYHRLEEKVTQKSRELIRSERLASVGYLAAGVAHEINNPLGIIAGYAEYTLAQLKQTPLKERDTELAKSLQVICDEAFRCKQIIGKLLSMVRPGEANRSAVDLGKVAADVASAVAGLRDYRDRKLTVAAAQEQDLLVSAIEVEMNQVVLNLALNALEAVPSGGEVRVEVARRDGWVELKVRDNGRGMSPQILEHVFEPFFTDKRGARQPGTGLGLSITHAIVESHGGSIRASSEGLGKGSEFVVQLPALESRRTAA